MRENQKLLPAVDALRHEEDQLQRARKEENFSPTLTPARGEVLRVLDELSKIVPTTLYFANLRYKAALGNQGSAERFELIPLPSARRYLKTSDSTRPRIEAAITAKPFIEGDFERVEGQRDET